MGIRQEDVIYMEVDEGTPGGDTYWVEIPKWEGELHAVCFRSIKRTDGKEKCPQKAGWKTNHFGTGACFVHGGSNTNNIQYKNGRHAKVTQMLLKDKINAFAHQDKQVLHDLTFELATVRVLLQETIEQFPTPDDKQYSAYVAKATHLVQVISSTMDKVSRVENRNAITAAQVMYLRTRIADLLVKWVRNPEDRQRAIDELASAIPGGHDDIMLIEA